MTDIESRGLLPRILDQHSAGSGSTSFWQNRRGSAISMMAAGLIPAIAALGGAIDAGRMYIVKSQLQTGVDAAALAGARAFGIEDGGVGDSCSVTDTETNPLSRCAQIKSYFYQNFPTAPAYMGVRNLTLKPTFKVTDGINQTVINASADVPMSFMRLFGIDQKPMHATAKAELQPRPLEVMVVLDNTGSMKADLPGGKTRMVALKDAAKSFVDILFQGGENRRDLGLGFIAYDITVNVGKLLTDWNPSSVRTLPLFNDATIYAYGKWPENTLAWKGCVMADDSVRDLNTTLTFRETNAWDIVRTLPGEPGTGHPPVTPFFVPPMWVPDLPASSTTLAAEKANKASTYYKVNKSIEPSNNLFTTNLTTDKALLGQLFNQSIYRKAIYDYYIGLNNGPATASDDVIVRASDDGYYDPKSLPWDFKTSTGTAFKIHYDQIPNLALWAPATEYRINPNGGRKSFSGTPNNASPDATPYPTPNWQCPEEAMPVAYGRPKSDYYSEIENDNGAIYPANGTLHHAGLLWGYRLLVRDDIFKRANPTNEQPKRALVFMTDGETALTQSQNGYIDRTFTFYGNYADKPISSDIGKLTEQSERRFSKTCAALQAEKNPPEVYIIALATTASGTLSMFQKCAPGHVYQTNSTSELKSAFQDVAAELVDLHLVK